MRRKMILLSVLVLLMLIAAAPLMSLAVKAKVNGEESRVATTDVQPAGVVFSEGFEGAFPGTAWSVGDSNSVNGYDYWDDTSYRAHAGSWSGWCAQVGSQTTATTIFTETFEGAFPGTAWTVGDWASLNGYDYWDDVSARAHAGSWSGWCNGYPDPYATNYDDNMNAYMYRAIPVSLSGYSTVYLSYYYYCRCESGYDYLQVMYWTGSTWTYADTHTGDLGNYWYYSSVSIPTTATYVGFRFYSDSSISGLIGAYVDDVQLYGYKNNSNVHMYDLNMNAYMYRYASLSAYSSATLSYYYWLNSESGYDYLRVMYWSGSTWYYIDSRTGNSGGWQYSSVSIPTTATYVGFYFYSDSIIASYEGAYIDDVSLVGTTTVANSVQHQYDNYMDAYMYRAVDLSAYSSATLSYYYWLNSESGFDTLRVEYYSGGVWYYVDSHTGNLGGWLYSSVSIPTTATYVGFIFHSDLSVTYEGAYLDDIVLTGTTATYSATINAYCNTEAAYVSVPITKDGSPTGYNTAYTFTGLTGTHTFTVPSKDAMGHHFKQWSTGSTGTTITVSSAGTYTAYYETPSIDIWTNKATYTIGETMYVYVQVRNIGPATPVRAIIKLGLPGGGTYGPLLDMTTTLPASFNSGTYLWNSFTIPTAPHGTYTWIAELRNPTTNALISSDTWTWTLS
ncbi:MAG: hypothetical protein ABSB28_01790 [Candidatus Bathyarchaeia archaeon]